MTTNHAPAWVSPRQSGVSLLPTGQWWDAVRVTCPLAECAFARLGPRTGAVIEDGRCALWYWLVEPGSAGHWPDLPGVRVRGRGGFVGVPPQGRVSGPGVHWRVPLAPGRYLTDPAVLYTALTAVAR